MIDPKLRCSCGWEGKTSELVEIEVFAGDALHPREVEDKCPCCDRPFDELEEVPLCAHCADVYVHEEDDVCGICVADGVIAVTSSVLSGPRIETETREGIFVPPLEQEVKRGR